MQIFYAPGISGDKWVLDQKESGHCIRVLRMKKGTLVRLIDGAGNLYEGIIEIPDPKACIVKVTDIIKDFEKRDYKLHIAISPLKNPDRLEWFIEKSVEIGVDEITPLICRNTEKTNIKKERLNGIIISAMKQSLKSCLTVLSEPTDFDEFIRYNYQANRMIAHCSEIEGEKKGISQVYKKGENAIILIGPEGDFSDKEIGDAIGAGFQPVHLGASRLRTETAGVAACHSIYFLNQ
jgi:16S rRNA (uracil1498-N3)-methyltransferase